MRFDTFFFQRNKKVTKTIHFQQLLLNSLPLLRFFIFSVLLRFGQERVSFFLEKLCFNLELFLDLLKQPDCRFAFAHIHFPIPESLVLNLKKSNRRYTRGIRLYAEACNEWRDHLHSLVPRQHSSEEKSQRSQAFAALCPI